MVHDLLGGVMTMSQPSRVSVTVGSTSRNGDEFEFKKITLSLERDLVPAENPVDAYRDIKALLERMVNEFQGSKPGLPQPGHPKPGPTGTSNPAGNEKSSGNPRLPVPKLATLQERLGARLLDVEVTDGLDGLIVKPRRYLADAWAPINEAIRALGGKWQKGYTPKDGS